MALGLAAGLGALAASLSKEVSLLALGPCALYAALPPLDASWSWRGIARGGLRAWPLGLGFGVGLGMRLWALGKASASDGASHIQQALLDLPLLWVDGWLNLWAPWTLSVRYLREDYAPLGWGWRVAALAGIAALSWAAWRWRKEAPAFGWGLLWFGGLLAPAALIASLVWYGFGRYLYLPATLGAVGVFQLGEHWLLARPALRRPLVWAVGAHLALLLSLHALAIRQWEGPEAFYRSIIEEQPRRSHGLGGLGGYYAQQGRFGEAVPWLVAALEVEPQDVRFRNNLIQSLFRLGKMPEAREVAAQGRRVSPTDGRFDQAWALASLDREPAEVVPAILEATRKGPDHKPTQRLLRIVLEEHPRKAEYRALLEPHADVVRRALPAAFEAPTP